MTRPRWTPSPLAPGLSDFLALRPASVGAAILAGGAARRFGGGDKGLQTVGATAMLERVRRTLEPQAAKTVLSANGNPRRFAALGLPVVADDPAYSGPLAGLLAALEWAEAEGLRWLLSVPGDTPFLPADLVLRLACGLGANAAAVAASGGRRHPVIGLWPVDALGRLRDHLAATRGGAIEAFAERLGTATVAWPTLPVDPFLNVNTPEDRSDAERACGAWAVRAGAVVLQDGVSSEALLRAFTAWAAARGLSLGGLVQRGGRADKSGDAEIVMVDLGTGATIPIMQKLGRDAICAIDTGAIATASMVLRRAIADRPDVVVVNKFGYLEADGGGLIDEMLAVMAEGLPLVTTVADKRVAAWLDRCGGQCELLPPDLAAIEAWCDRQAAIALA